jgi:hypothetical protein
MDEISGIGVQPVAPTAGTPAERKKPTLARPSKEQRAGADRAPPAPGTGRQVDKVA